MPPAIGVALGISGQKSMNSTCDELSMCDRAVEATGIVVKHSFQGPPLDFQVHCAWSESWESVFF